MDRKNLINQFFDKFYENANRENEFFDEYKKRLVNMVIKEVNSIKHIENDHAAVVLAINNVGQTFHKIIKFNFQPITLKEFEEIVKGE